jgi:hypothetical protein
VSTLVFSNPTSLSLSIFIITDKGKFVNNFLKKFLFFLFGCCPFLYLIIYYIIKIFKNQYVILHKIAGIFLCNFLIKNRLTKVQNLWYNGNSARGGCPRAAVLSIGKINKNKKAPRKFYSLGATFYSTTTALK